MEKEVIKKTKKPVNGKKKGNGYELVISKILTKELSPLKFVRTQGSGARVGGQNFHTIGQMFGEDALKLFVGDVVCTNESQIKVNFLHSIECKFYKDSDSFETMVGGNSNIFKWMKESIIDAEKIKKNPVIIFKWNRTTNYFGIRSQDRINMIPNQIPKLTLIQNDLSIDIFYLEDIIKIKDFWYKPIV